MMIDDDVLTNQTEMGVGNPIGLQVGVGNTIALTRIGVDHPRITLRMATNHSID